jgi:tricorn protease
MKRGYYSEPAIHGSTLYFRADDNFWKCSADGGKATCLTQCRGIPQHPRISPDGQWIAFTGKEEGMPDVYVMPATGGPLRRLTYSGHPGATVIGWTPDSESVIFTTHSNSPFRGWNLFHTISLDGVHPVNMNLGWGSSISFVPDGTIIIGRFGRDPAQWKRYRGGRAGEIWTDIGQKGKFRRLLNLKSNITHPVWLNNRVYFIGDHDGTANIWSCDENGGSIEQHTFHRDFYIRNPQNDGHYIVYQCAGEIYRYNSEDNFVTKISIDLPSPFRQLQRKMPSLEKYLESIDLSPSNTHCVAVARGKLFHFANWSGAAVTRGNTDGHIRYRLPQWLDSREQFVAVSDEEGEEKLVIFSTDSTSEPRKLSADSLGRVQHLKVIPGADIAILTNHRYQLLEVDLKSGKTKVLDKDKHFRMNRFDISSDGRWIAYSRSIDPHRTAIIIHDRNTRHNHVVTNPVRMDFNPVFDPKGKTIYFLSARAFNPVRDQLDFNYSFPMGIMPMALTLQTDTLNPFEQFAQSPVNDSPDKSGDADVSDKNKTEPSKPVAIDFEGILDRTVAMPVTDSIYSNLNVSKDKIWMLEEAVAGLLSDKNDTPEGTKLVCYDFESKKLTPFLSGVEDYKISRDGRVILVKTPGKLRILDASKPAPKDKQTGFSRESGWIDLSRLKVAINPAAEWQQMFREAWRLMRDDYFAENMSGVDWNAVYDRYKPLVQKISTRSELSDLIWECYGEMGTSHSYEFAGDYESLPDLNQGMLGIDLNYDSVSDTFIITHIVKGDSWDSSANSPLNQPGINVKPGDRLVAINGRKVNGLRHPGQELAGIKNEWVTLTVSDGSSERDVTVKTIMTESSARLREWVNRTSDYVHYKTDGRVGYLYIQDMGTTGFSQFHRAWLAESFRDALIIDVRHNGGGHISSLLLEKLSRKQLGFCASRHAELTSEPPFCARGPLVTLCDEFSGSDGDLFAHKFKLMKLGTLIGHRTWGGVVGISPQLSLVDGAIVTQPEFYHWFTDVGWNLENYGAEPDIPIDITPHEFGRGDDPQLEKAISVILKQLKDNPPLAPEMGPHPQRNLTQD